MLENPADSFDASITAQGSKESDGCRITLTPTEKRRLLDVVNDPASATRLIRRAKTLLYLDQGLSVNTISEKLGIVKASVYNCRRKYIQFGIDRAVYDGARPGGPRRISDEAIAWMKSIVGNPPSSFGLNARKWTVSLLQKYICENAEASGFPSLTYISRSRLWTLACAEEASAEQPSPTAEGSNSRNIMWTEILVRIEDRADCLWHIADRTYSTGERLKSAGSSIRFIFGIDMANSAIEIVGIKRNDRTPLLTFLKTLEARTAPTVTVFLHSYGHPQVPKPVAEYLQEHSDRFVLISSRSNSDIANLAFHYAMGYCDQFVRHFTAPSADELTQLIQRRLQGLRPPVN